MFPFSRLIPVLCTRSQNALSPTYCKLCLHTSSRRTDDQGSDNSKSTRPSGKKVQNTVKPKREDGRTLIKKISKELHPERTNYKKRQNTEAEIKGRLKLINDKAALREVGGADASAAKFTVDDFSKSQDGANKQGRNTSSTRADRFHGHDQRAFRHQAKHAAETGSQTLKLLAKFKKKPGKNHRDSAVPTAIHTDESVINEYVSILLGTEERLKLFEPISKTEADTDESGEPGHKTATDWWDEHEAEIKERESYKQMKSPYEEMFEWTMNGKFPEFPINNEVGMEHELDIPFHKHVFLHDFIDEGFPKQGPVRQFMEAVILGLSRNPYLALEEKEDHINWFREYFAEKYELLKTLGAVKDEQMLS